MIELANALRHSLPVAIPLQNVAIVTNPYQIGTRRVADPRIEIFDSGARVVGETPAGQLDFTFKFEQVVEVRTRGRDGLFIRLRSGEVMFADVPDRDLWLRISRGNGVRSIQQAPRRSIRS